MIKAKFSDVASLLRSVVYSGPVLANGNKLFSGNVSVSGGKWLHFEKAADIIK